MAFINRYVLVDTDSNESDYEYDTYHEALDAAERAKGRGERFAIIEREYEYSDSSLVWTPDDGCGYGAADIVWPPKED